MFLEGRGEKLLYKEDSGVVVTEILDIKVVVNKQTPLHSSEIPFNLKRDIMRSHRRLANDRLRNYRYKNDRQTSSVRSIKKGSTRSFKKVAGERRLRLQRRRKIHK